MTILDVHRLSEQLMRTANMRKEAAILEQLNTLITADVLIIEETEPVLVKAGDMVEIRQSVKLTFRGKEVVEELKAENTKLREQIAVMRKALAAADALIGEK